MNEDFWRPLTVACFLFVLLGFALGGLNCACKLLGLFNPDLAQRLFDSAAILFLLCHLGTYFYEAAQDT